MLQIILWMMALVPATLPPRLVLENVVRSSQTQKSLLYWTSTSRAFKHMDLRSHLTPTGHVLWMMPLDGLYTYPIDRLLQDPVFQDVRFVDGVDMFSSEFHCFRCFITGSRHSSSKAVRIQGTPVWVLVSNLMESNRYKSSIDRREFYEIQSGFLKMVSFDEKAN